MNKVSIKPIGEEGLLAICFKKEDGHEITFVVRKGDNSVKVCETFPIEDISLFNLMISLPLKWLEGAMEQGLSHHKDSWEMITPMGNKFAFTKKDFKNLQDYLDINGGGSNA